MELDLEDAKKSLKAWLLSNIADTIITARKVDKWVDVMKNKVFLIKYTRKGFEDYNEVAIASVEYGKPKIEYSIKGFFDEDPKLLYKMRLLSQKVGITTMYVALMNDYFVAINHKTGEVLTKEKLSLRERFKYKALWQKMIQEYAKVNKHNN